MDSQPAPKGYLLVVDDSRTMRLGLIRALNNLGFRNITEATNGRHALELVLSTPFDLMLLDMEMPEMNGMEVLAALKAKRHGDRYAGFKAIVELAAKQLRVIWGVWRSGVPYDPARTGGLRRQPR